MESCTYQERCNQLLHLRDSANNSMEVLKNKHEKEIEQKEISKENKKKLTHFNNLRWDLILIEEALALKEKKVREHLRYKTEYLHNIKLKVIEKHILLENLAKKIVRHLKQVNTVIEFARTKETFLGKELTLDQIKKLALDEFEKEVGKSVLRKVERSIAKASSGQLTLPQNMLKGLSIKR